MPLNDASARLDLPYVAAGQLQKHVTINEALTRLDALVHAAVASRTVAGQPTDAPDGTLYILPADATGPDWSTRSSGDLVCADSGGWTAVPVPDGLIAVVLDTGALILRRDGGWTGFGAIDGLGRLGLNATADAANPFAARVNKALWTALETGSGGDGDLRLTFNKEGPADVLSLLFQSGFGGRAELGLIGDDDLTLKVSADGGTWHEALRVDRATGRIGFPTGAARCQTTIFDDWGDYAVPTWARWLEVVVVGGGGGGGAGAAGASGTVRYGGGGGGAGGISTATWPTEALPATLQIATGWGATGGTGASGSGAGGGAGGPSSITASGTVLISGPGGFGGQGGTSSSGTGASGAAGLTLSNGGGSGAVSQTGQAGQALPRPDGSGGGGGGGGLDAANTARSGGAGGDGATLGRVASGGTGGTAAPGGSGQSASEPAHSWAGGGGGGGGANAGGSGHAGGTGASAGAGGGGGGASSTLSGSGGQGGRGRVRITAFG